MPYYRATRWSCAVRAYFRNLTPIQTYAAQAPPVLPDQIAQDRQHGETPQPFRILPLYGFQSKHQIMVHA